MTPYDLGVAAGTFLLGAGSVLGGARILKHRKVSSNDTLGLARIDCAEPQERFVTCHELERLIGVEKRVEGLEHRVSAIEQNAEHRYQLLLEAITALGDRIADQLREMAGRLDGRIDDVYRGPDRRSRS